nr:MAG TPA: hypothetical protein [Caudoviricetes sp.]DAU66865.1 MAG TPA: hypothetical protein [Caudoviricetes sp.]
MVLLCFALFLVKSTLLYFLISHHISVKINRFP